MTPPQSPITVPASRVLTVPVPCGSGDPPMLSIRALSAGETAGRCADGVAARFTLKPTTFQALRHTGAVQATVTAGAFVRALKLTARPRARAAAISGTWRDATLECYPLGGGRLGGGPNNSSVDLVLHWKSSTASTYWARHAVFYEEYWNGSGPYFRTPSGQYANTTPYSDPYRISPTGVIEWMVAVPNYGFTGSITQINPWTNEQTYPKTYSIRVRAQVGLSTYDGSTWSAPTWHFATPVHPALGYAEGICALN
jgi:hypothetical protein